MSTNGESRDWLESNDNCNSTVYSSCCKTSVHSALVGINTSHKHKNSLFIAAAQHNRMECFISTDKKRDPDITISTSSENQIYFILLCTLYLREDGGSMDSTIQCKYLVDPWVLIGASNVQSCHAILYRSWAKSVHLVCSHCPNNFWSMQHGDGYTWNEDSAHGFIRKATAVDPSRVYKTQSVNNGIEPNLLCGVHLHHSWLKQKVFPNNKLQFRTTYKMYSIKPLYRKGLCFWLWLTEISCKMCTVC